ncbi:MAG TPA: L,D-transpeptidase family protein [Acidimicrobiia bacterium]
MVAVVIVAVGVWVLRPHGEAHESAASVATVPPSTSTSAAPQAAASTLAEVGSHDIDAAEQVIIVTPAGDDASQATLSAYEMTDGSWREAFGPWDAVVGAGGVAEADAKREGDRKTPSGSYPFDFFFGIHRDPGVRFPYRQVTGPQIVWDDDSSSANYNQWVDSSVDESVGVSPEPMDNSPVYDYGAVVAYNAERTPGLGSAIFLHVSAGSATAGCVAVPEEHLLELLRWLDPARQPRIVIRAPSESTADVTTAALER